MNYFQKIESLKIELENNKIIKEIYNVRDNAKKFLDDIVMFKEFKKEDYEDIYNSFISNINFLKRYINREDFSLKEEKKINDLIFEIANEFIKKEEFFVYIEDKEKKAILIALQCMLVLYTAISYEEKDIESFLQIDTESDFQIKNMVEGKYYRGENDFSYKLLPSIYRNYDVKRYGNNFKKQTMRDLYKDTNLISKYKTVFEFLDINYDFCAYMQHSKSYSPFLDLTSEPYVALTFATKASGDLNKYMKADASLYEFSFEEKPKELNDNNPYILDEHFTYITDKKLRISTTIGKIPLCKCTYRHLEIDVFILKKKSNDRMKYQQGIFLYINKAIIVKGIMLMPMSIGKITKYKIPSDKKTVIYNANKRNRAHYDYEHLMDPYMLFNDAPNS